ncbi:MAG: pyridoxamine 5-phosphate oxidase family protein [Pelosinus sp.]|jgi:nitroimidazol reductase NimA-like FMN-containing flavoprotein (pyridoxamine 5'-phosphate oxidase superfamily)|nr:pyridoxamine 5-phosphate oxidase family protein [Pelosinus sp.]
MRRQDREVTDFNEILEITKKCNVCRVAFFGEEYPYIIPLNFGVRFDGTEFKLYFHAAKEGTKLDLLRKNPNVGFEMDCNHNLVMQDNGNCTMEFESVCGNGIMRIVEDEEKVLGLTVLMEQYHGENECNFPEHVLKMTEVMELTVKEITGKRLKVKN